jgi:hypothetical protein
MNFVFLELCSGLCWVAAMCFAIAARRTFGKIFSRMSSSGLPDQQWRYLPPWQRFRVVKEYHSIFGNDELWREWMRNLNWTVAFFLLACCFQLLEFGH